ncbi:hypothetical protein LSH36_282g01023 [Paralvinella palmiformis]|uniref:EGF-like domain-containing protein n=1 Tax=Paralvinella palmiformis TaxID=53620 RepID=A0AAD9N3P4_9ANNE|nr:hypothetical protein LSH36_282g01023 [Paralvinella palmiformis]
MNLFCRALCLGIFYAGNVSAATSTISRQFLPIKPPCRKPSNPAYFDTDCAQESVNYDLKCSTCQTGYSPSSDALTCQACHLEQCEKCSSTGTVCELCRAGYVVSGGSCAGEFLFSGTEEEKLSIARCNDTCPANCLSCTLVNDVIECQTCVNQFYVHQSNPSLPCLYCPPLCTDCDGIELGGFATCLTCTSGYILQNTTCNACSSNCSSCVEGGEMTTTCTTCNSGFGLLYGICKECINTFTESCTVFSNGTQTIDACLTGYEYIPFGVCNACPSKCTNCTENVCYECLVGYLLDVDHRCIESIDAAANDNDSPDDHRGDGDDDDHESIRNAGRSDGTVGRAQCRKHLGSGLESGSFLWYLFSPGRRSIGHVSQPVQVIVLFVLMTSPVLPVIRDMLMLIGHAQCNTCANTSYCTTCNTGYIAFNGSCTEHDDDDDDNGGGDNDDDDNNGGDDITEILYTAPNPES